MLEVLDPLGLHITLELAERYKGTVLPSCGSLSGLRVKIVLRAAFE